MQNEPVAPIRALQKRWNSRSSRSSYGRSSSHGWGYPVALLVLLLAILFVVPPACSAATDDQKAIDAAENLGFTEVEIISKSAVYHVFGDCAKSDDARYKMSGINPAGKRVEFVVCAGVFKGGTVRSTG